MKRNENQELVQQSLVESTPLTSRLRNGGEFDPAATVWQLKSGVESVRVDFSEAGKRLSPEMLLGYKRTLEWFARNKSLETVNVAHRSFMAMLSLARTPVVKLIDDTMVLGYLGSGDGIPAGWSILKTFLKKWHEQRSECVSENAYKVAVKAKTSQMTEQRDQALLTLCPIKGPFSAMERDAFHKAYHEAFANGAITEAEYVAVCLVKSFGVRPAQLAQMKVKDLGWAPNKGGLEYVLSIPSAKKAEKSRAKFKKRLLIPELGEMMRAYCTKIIVRFSEDGIENGELPLFPMERVMPGHVWSEGFKLHKTSAGMGSVISDVEGKIKCVSERTGETMNINARRFRYTLGTVMAEEGHPASTIAEALDHEGLGTVTSYVAVTGKLHGRLNKAMAMQLAPMAQAFAGTLIDRGESQPGLKTVRDIRVEGTYEPVGNCGKSSVCHYAAPIACYTCKNFRPFLDAPHEPLLDYMLAERERLLAVSGPNLAAVEDRTIIAIAEVLSKCNEVKRG